MNIVVVNVFRRPFHTRLCLEAIARAQRWSGGWADSVQVWFACNHAEHPDVMAEADDVGRRNPDIPFIGRIAPPDIPSTPHDMSRYMLDLSFGSGAEMAVYVEDDAVLSPDAFLMCEVTRQAASGLFAGPVGLQHNVPLLGCCLYHETIPEQYVREGRPEGPDARLLHLGNGLNTCGGTAFLREPYLRYLSPEWNCKECEPKGFDYSAHFLMYKYGLYMVWPDYSRSVNIGYEHGSIAPADWAKYFGRSLWVQTGQAARDWKDFRFDGVVPPLVREEWMIPELAYRGLL